VAFGHAAAENIREPGDTTYVEGRDAPADAEIVARAEAEAEIGVLDVLGDVALAARSAEIGPRIDR